MRTLELALKDLRQVLRDRRALLFLLVMPIVFTGFMGFAQRPPEPGDPRLPVGLVIADDGVLGAQLPRLIEASTTVRPVAVAEAAELDERVRTGELAAAVVLPAGFSRQALAGETLPIQLIADTLTPTGQTARQAVQGIVTRLLGTAEIGRLSVERLPARERDAAWERAVLQAADAWLAAPLAIRVELATAPQAETPRPAAFAQSSPGMLVMFALFSLTNTALVLVLERKTRTLQRMLTTSMSRAEIILGHLLAMFTLVFVQGLILIVFGQLAFGVDYLREPLAVLLVLAALALCVASLGLLLSALAKGEEQVTLFALIAMFVFSALGGAWFPLEGVGSTFAALGHLTPAAWAMTGFQNIIVRGLGLGSILLPVGLLLAYAGGFFGLAVWRFRFE